MNQSSNSSETIKAPNPRFKFDCSAEILREFYHLPLADAAKALGTCPATLKRNCRRHAIPFWPYRTLHRKAARAAKPKSKPIATPEPKTHTSSKKRLPAKTTCPSSPTDPSDCAAFDELLRAATSLQQRNLRNKLFPLEAPPLVSANHLEALLIVSQRPSLLQFLPQDDQ